MAGDKYKLLFGGSAEEEVLIGTLEKGNAIIKGTPMKGKFRKGNCVFPNRTQAWGRRLLSMKEGKAVEKPYSPDSRIDASHKDYAGVIEWLKWGDKNGYMIEARYEPTCSTLDYQYQISRLGLPTLANDLEHNYLEFPSGYNEFDDTKGILIEFLKIHHNNGDSTFCNPNSEFPMAVFKEVKEYNSREFAAKEADTAFDAVKFVKEANSFEKLKVLKTVLSRVTEITYDISKENSLYESLVLYASKNSKKFLEAIQGYKEQVSKLIELGKAYTAFDCTLNGVIYVVLPKKEMLIDEVDAEGDDMLQWLFDNCLEPRVYDAIEKLNLYSQKFKS